MVIRRRSNNYVDSKLTRIDLECAERAVYTGLYSTFIDVKKRLRATLGKKDYRWKAKAVFLKKRSK